MKNIIAYALFLLQLVSCSDEEVKKTTWRKFSTPSNGTITDMHFIDEDFGVASGGVSDHLMKSHDGGESWQEVYVGPAGTLTSVFVLDPQQFYASRMGLFETKTNGRFFGEIGELSNVQNTIFDIYFFNYDEGIIIKGGHIYKTLDAGEHWSEVYPLTNSPLSTKRFEVISSTDATTMYLVGSSSFQVGSQAAMYKSIDRGESWEKLNIPNANSSEITTIHFLNDQTGFISTIHGDILRTDDGGINWIEVSALGFTLSGLSFESIEVGHMIAGQHIYKTTDGGVNWNIIFESENELILMTTTPEGTIIIANRDGYIYKSE